MSGALAPLHNKSMSHNSVEKRNDLRILHSAFTHGQATMSSAELEARVSPGHLKQTMK